MRDALFLASYIKKWNLSSTIFQIYKQYFYEKRRGKDYFFYTVQSDNLIQIRCHGRICAPGYNIF